MHGYIKGFFTPFLTILFLLALHTTNNAQVISRNLEGEIIVSYRDGSWRYFMGTDSILLVEEYQNFILAEKQSTQVPDAIDEPEVKVIEVEEVEALEPTSLDTIKEEVAPIEVEVIEEEPLLTMDEQELLELTERRLTLTERLRRVESGYIELSEKEIRKVKEELVEINEKLDQYVNQESEEIDESVLRETTNKRYNKNDYIFSSKELGDEVDECDVTVERDEFTNKKKAAVRSSYFFQYTPEEMRKHLKGGHYLDAYAAVAHVGGNTILSIYTVINTRSQQSGYGVLQKGSSLRIKLSNGEVMTLYNSRQDAGRRDVNEHKYYYTGRYGIDKDTLKRLTKYNVDTIRINWSAGYEDYEVYHVSLLKDQLNCLFKAL